MKCTQRWCQLQWAPLKTVPQSYRWVISQFSLITVSESLFDMSYDFSTGWWSGCHDIPSTQTKGKQMKTMSGFCLCFSQYVLLYQHYLIHLLQSGGECVRAFLAKGYNQLTTLNIGGVSGTDYALQVQHKALFSLNTKPRFLIFAHEC